MNKNESQNHDSITYFNLMTSLLAVLNSNEEEDINLVLARYLLENFHKLGSLSIYDVAAECYTSLSSVKRFAKLIGYESFTAMKQNAPVTLRHMDAFVQYARHPEFDQYLTLSIDQMMADINQMFAAQELSRPARRLHDSGLLKGLRPEYLVMVTSTTGNYAIASIQELKKVPPIRCSLP